MIPSFFVLASPRRRHSEFFFYCAKISEIRKYPALSVLNNFLFCSLLMLLEYTYLGTCLDSDNTTANLLYNESLLQQYNEWIIMGAITNNNNTNNNNDNVINNVISRIVIQSSNGTKLVGIVILLVLYIIIRIILVGMEMKYNRCRRSKKLQQQQQQPNNNNNNNNMNINTNNNTSNKKPKSTLIVLGSGGHTTEILMMTKHLNRSYYNPIVYCKAITDTTSYDRIIESTKSISTTTTTTTTTTTPVLYDIPRSREVGQSFISSIPTTLYALYKSLTLILILHPDIIICNGPGTCIPIIGIALLYRILFPIRYFHCTIIFIESYCRVQSLSLTGKILYKLRCTDLFIVHWNELHQQYPSDTILTTTFIDE